ncbi:hypothetical protein NKG05_26890 [Oerskovia sp. M15]
MWGLEQLGVHYMPAAVVSAAVTIVTNFLLLEHLVFHDLRDEGAASGDGQRSRSPSTGSRRPCACPSCTGSSC